VLILALRARGLLHRCDVPLVVEAVEDAQAEGRIPEDLVVGAMVSIRFREVTTLLDRRVRNEAFGVGFGQAHRPGCYSVGFAG